MNDNEQKTTEKPTRLPPRNYGKLTCAKPTLRPSRAWPIGTRLQMEGRTRDLAMFNLAIDSAHEQGREALLTGLTP